MKPHVPTEAAGMMTARQARCVSLPCTAAFHAAAYFRYSSLIHMGKGNLRHLQQHDWDAPWLEASALHQVEFDGIKHHMSMDRDVIISLEILQPTKSRSALQKALIGNINGSTAAVLQRQKGLQDGALGAADLAGGTRGNYSQPTGPSRPVQESGNSAEQPRFRRRGRQSCAQQSMPIINYRTNSLFGFLNNTTTAAGARLLRTNLLQPLTDITTLELRLDSLQELLESPHLTLELTSLMETLPKNLDKVCSNLAVQPQSATSTKDPSTRLGRLVSSVILLRDVLRCLPVMADSMAWVDCDLLKV
eukprot:GHUV01018739.1.p1 GENE.GHUV01018739.1~~GHUV01018739.1.p1  ORF type:complete len:305 (+),score=89.73 GHUV01018739.1:1078-1992(+)